MVVYQEATGLIRWKYSWEGSWIHASKKGGHNFDVIRGKGKMVKFILDQAMKAQKGAEV